MLILEVDLETMLYPQHFSVLLYGKSFFYFFCYEIA